MIIIMSAFKDAHQIERYNQIVANCEIDVMVLGYERSPYVNPINFNHITLGTLGSSKMKRLCTYLKSLWIMSKIIENDSQIYVFGSDNLLLISILNIFKFQKLKILYEISDLRPYHFSNKMIPILFQGIEKYCLLRTEKIIVTSESYIEDYYRKIKDRLNWYLLENKVSVNLTRPAAVTLNKVVIGYFGFIRCRKSLEVLLSVAEGNSQFEIIIYGFFHSDLENWKNRLVSIKNISYGGTYHSPRDLEEIYSKINVSWICYPYSNEMRGNWKHARTNRYYEAGFFKKPMIVREGTQDAKWVEKLDIGIIVDLQNTNDVVCRLNHLSLESLDNFIKNLDELPTEMFQNMPVPLKIV